MRISRRFTAGRVHGSAIAIVAGLVLAYAGGLMNGGQKGLADVPVFAGIGLMGGAMLRDFAIVATAFEVDVVEARKAAMRGPEAGMSSTFPTLWSLAGLGETRGATLRTGSRPALAHHPAHGKCPD